MTAHVAYAGGYSIAGTLDFELNLEISCTSTTFETLIISDMAMLVLGASDTQVIPALTDTVSGIAGSMNGYDFCGDRIYSISTTPSSYFSDVL